jgi:hypothetical protein
MVATGFAPSFPLDRFGDLGDFAMLKVAQAHTQEFLQCLVVVVVLLLCRHENLDLIFDFWSLHCEMINCWWPFEVVLSRHSLTSDGQSFKNNSQASIKNEMTHHDSTAKTSQQWKELVTRLQITIFCARKFSLEPRSLPIFCRWSFNEQHDTLLTWRWEVLSVPTYRISV